VNNIRRNGKQKKEKDIRNIKIEGEEIRNKRRPGTAAPPGSEWG
jgi:hypothetical protein